MLFGVIGLFKYKNFYPRILVSSKIDTAGAFTVIIGIAVRHGFGFFSLKLLLLIILMMIINPLIAHMTARSAYLSGYSLDDDGHDKDSEDQI
jgi:multicomponent Na+:H+ antiporter subunit G